MSVDVMNVHCTSVITSKLPLNVSRVQTALHKAAWFGYVDICKILVEAGASLDKQDYKVICQVYIASCIYRVSYRILK